jgi:hypothetical protein
MLLKANRLFKLALGPVLMLLSLASAGALAAESKVKDRKSVV